MEHNGTCAEGMLHVYSYVEEDFNSHTVLLLNAWWRTAALTTSGDCRMSKVPVLGIVFRSLFLLRLRHLKRVYIHVQLDQSDIMI